MWLAHLRRRRRGCAPITLILASLMLAGAAHGQSECIIYGEPFDSFAGPHDLDDGVYQVRWCSNGASVASGSFCPTGNAFKLDGAADDPVVWFTSASSSCTSVTIEFDYSQFTATNTQLLFAVTSDASFDCSRGIFQSAGMLSAVDGACTHVSHTVPIMAGQSVYWKFDHGSNGNAIFIDSVTIAVRGCCAGEQQQPCCAQGDAGCADTAVQDCVCAQDPFCCDVAWDAQCVAEVESLRCGSCSSAGDCVDGADGAAVDFGTLYEPGSVCALFSGVFASCEGIGPFLSSSSTCAGSGDMAMSFGTGFPYSAAIMRCIDLSAVTSARLEFEWTKTTGTLGPRVDISTDGSTFTTVWTAPTLVDGEACRSAAVDLTDFAGQPSVQIRLSAGSSVANGAALDEIVLFTSDGSSHDCCTVGTAGCASQAIQDCVCAIDPFCCDVAWDDLCVISVEYYQCGDCGLCVDEFATDFGDSFVGGTICDVLPELFVLCQGSGPWLTSGTTCGGANDMAELFGSGSEVSAAITRCLNLADETEAALQFTYSKLDGTVGPVVEISLDAGGTFAPIWVAPASPGTGCHSVCLDLSGYAGLPYVHLAFHNGDPSTSGAAIDDVQLLRGVLCVPPGASPDLDGNGIVDVFDLFALLKAWGACPSAPASCPADLDSSGAVDVFDLFQLLNAWG